MKIVDDIGRTLFVGVSPLRQFGAGISNWAVVIPKTLEKQLFREALGHRSKDSGRVTIRLMLNGEPTEFPRNLTISGLLATLGLAQGKVAIERNLEIVPKSSFDEVRLEDNDRIEIVHFIGGG